MVRLWKKSPTPEKTKVIFWGEYYDEHYEYWKNNSDDSAFDIWWPVV